MFSCLRARGFRKTCVTSVICHRLFGLGIVELCALVGFHFFRRAADNNKASAAAGADSLEAKLYEGSAHVDGTELLADAGTDDLQGSRHGHELASLRRTGLAEVQVHQFPFEMGCLELSVMLVQLLDFFFLKPILEAALVEGVGFGINGIVVEGVLPRRTDALHLEGQPTAVACGVRQELRVVASATERGDMLAMLMIVGVGGSLVDARHRNDGFELVQLGRAHRVEFFAADEGVLGEGEEVVLAHAVGIGLRVEVLLQSRGKEVVEPGGFEGALFAYQHEDDVVDGIVGEPAGDHGDEPLLQVMFPAVLFALSAFYTNRFCQCLNRFCSFIRTRITRIHTDLASLVTLIGWSDRIREFRVVPCETFKILSEGIERGDVVGLDDAVEVLLVDSRYRGHFCPKGVDLSVINRESVVSY